MKTERSKHHVPCMPCDFYLHNNYHGSFRLLQTNSDAITKRCCRTPIYYWCYSFPIVNKFFSVSSLRYCLEPRWPFMWAPFSNDWLLSSRHWPCIASWPTAVPTSLTGYISSTLHCNWTRTSASTMRIYNYGTFIMVTP